jgi:hypothetical protein
VLIGPMLGGLLYYFGPVFDYGVCAGLTLTAAVGAFLLPNPGRPAKQMELSWESVAVGFRFIWNRQTMLGAMLFEFMASLFGSVQALLPLYARDILEVGAWGAGLLRSATALGALVAAAVLTRMPIKSAGGFWLFSSFALLGAATIVFGFSTNLIRYGRGYFLRCAGWRIQLWSDRSIRWATNAWMISVWMTNV